MRWHTDQSEHVNGIGSFELINFLYEISQHVLIEMSSIPELLCFLIIQSNNLFFHLFQLSCNILIINLYYWINLHEVSQQFLYAISDFLS